MRHATRRGGRAVAGVIAALALVGCGQPAAQPAPQGPIDVRVTELSPEVMDQLADKVAERVVPTLRERVVEQPVVSEQPVRPDPVRPVPERPVVRPVPARPVDVGPEDPRVAAPPPPPPSTDPLAGSTLLSAEAAVEDALEWLTRNQEPGGQWDPAAGRDARGGESAQGDRHYAPGVTGLAVRCYLGAGQTHMSGADRKTVRRGLQYLKNIQDPEGCFGPRTSAHFQYNHASAALAMAEAWEATRSELFARSAQLGVDFVHRSQNPYLGWRYGVRDGDNDTSVTGWMVQVLRGGEAGGLRVDRGAYRGAISWVDKMTEPEFGRVGYQRRGGAPARTTEMTAKFPPQYSESLTAVGMNIRVDGGQDPGTHEYIRKGARLLAQKPPRWTDRGSIDFYYWYWGTMAMADIGGDHWRLWSRALVTALVDNQSADGSWDPVGPWTSEGGRAYSTAMACLALQELLRFEREKEK